MNHEDRDLATLLHDVTDDLAPDVALLVAGGVARGRRTRQRRRLGAAAAAAVAVGALGVTLGVASTGRGADGVQVADGGTPSPSAGSPTQSSSPTADPSPARRPLAVSQDEIPALFGTMIAGKVVTSPQKEDVANNPVVDFTWNGFAVRVGITQEEYVSGQRGIPPLERCAVEHQRSECEPAPDGGVIASDESTGPVGDGAVTDRRAQVYTADGWDVLVMMSNAATWKDNPVLAPEPPLTQEQLRRVALSDAWFE